MEGRNYLYVSKFLEDLAINCIISKTESSVLITIPYLLSSRELFFCFHSTPRQVLFSKNVGDIINLECAEVKVSYTLSRNLHNASLSVGLIEKFNLEDLATSGVTGIKNV